MSAKRTSLALATFTLLASSGCGLFGNGSGGSSLIQVVATHHGSVDEDGDYPDYGDGDSRLFTTDDDWNVHLTNGYITTSGVTLRNCDGGEAEVRLFNGQLAEDITRLDDLQKTNVGSLEVPAVELCGLTVHYGKFDPEESSSRPRSSAVEGTSIYLEGVAAKDGARVEFEVSVREALDVDLDMSTMRDGEPFRVSGKEAFPVELVLRKTYDRFFDDLDFETATEDDLEQQALAVLERESYVTIR